MRTKGGEEACEASCVDKLLTLALEKGDYTGILYKPHGQLLLW